MTETHPEIFDIVQVIEGDLTEVDRCNIKEEDWKMLVNQVNIILHLAATVNFNEHLQTSFKINVQGVKNMIDLAQECKNLKSFVHVSTAYVNFTRKGSEVDEIIYYTSKDPESKMKEVMEMTEKEIERNTKTIIRPYPNTYTYTKMMGESLIQKYKKNLPICIVRPTMVVPSFRDPFPGWVDSLIGPAGLSVACGLGYLHAMNVDRKSVADFVPVDFVCSAIIAASWHLAQHPEKKKTRRVTVFHLSSSAKNPVTW
eukprot:CAMPEP_0174261254 /NCGR_PEP_ID=MMETSP0439-20130205/11324_1 /TAXON_ID=0 /ORGANISM="Stereomyxa ramosa, Strain Chinc5" /LENGTH=255 /DNA_ID=CAMNT_0015345707 /DNA_START=291 /DNA_END=1055 /DNA_ORIENTATION=-